MTITYRTTGAWGSGKGSNLTPVEVDSNFYDLTVRVTFMEDNPPQAVSVVSVEQTSSNQIIFHMSDSSILGPITIPAAEISFKGDWQPTTPYIVGDIVDDNGSLYIVNVDHTSQGTFDPGYTTGSPPHQVYSLILSPPGNVIPTGGATGDVLTKLSNTNYDMTWVTPHYLPAGGTAGQALVKTTGFDYQTEWGDLVKTIDDLTDVVITGPLPGQTLRTGQALRYNVISGIEVLTNEEDIASIGWFDWSIVDLQQLITGYFVAPCDGALDGIDLAVTSPANATQHNVTYSTAGAFSFNFATLASIQGSATVNAGWLALGRPTAAFGILDTEYKIVTGTQSGVTDNVKTAAVAAVDWIAEVDALASTSLPSFVTKGVGSATNSASIANGSGLTGLSNDVIVVILAFYYSTPNVSISVSGLTNSGTLLTWTRRSFRNMLGAENANTAWRYEVWWAPATASFTNMVVTASLANVPSPTIYGLIDAFAVRGLNNPSSPWDTSVTLPSYGSSDLLDGTVQCQINGSNVAGAHLTVGHSALAGTVYSADASPRIPFAKGDQLSLVPAGFAAQPRIRGQIRYVPHLA